MLAKIKNAIFPFWISLLIAMLFSHLHALENQRVTPQRYNMYSSDQHHFVWFRVFKVASTSIKSVLVKNVPDLTQSRPATFPKQFENHFKFAFVRNPWDRVVSCYFNKVLTKKAPDFQECFDKDFDFFVDFINKLDVEKTNSHLKLQTKLIPVQKCDFIGKMDNFENDFHYVCSVIGINSNEIPHRHKTNHIHYSAYYTPRTQEIIAKKYQEDIEAFGFTFETQ